jgi:hypothetical protein
MCAASLAISKSDYDSIPEQLERLQKVVATGALDEMRSNAAQGILDGLLWVANLGAPPIIALIDNGSVSIADESAIDRVIDAALMIAEDEGQPKLKRAYTNGLLLVLDWVAIWNRLGRTCKKPVDRAIDSWTGRETPSVQTDRAIRETDRAMLAWLEAERARDQQHSR